MTAMTGPDLAAVLVMAVVALAICALWIAKRKGWL